MPVAHSLRLASPGDHVQPPEAGAIGVRLVARIEDGAARRRVDAHHRFEEVGTLRQLQRARIAALDAHPTGAGEDLARHQEGHQRVNQVVQRHRT